MDGLTVKIIAILGLCFQFFSFWLAAPEILGVEWLKKTKSILKKIISQIPNYILLLFGSIIGAVLVRTGDNYYLFSFTLLLLILVYLLRKKISAYLETKISEPLISRLISSNRLRFGLLKTAAVFFTIGFLLQLVAIVWG